jgi:DNA-binding transcriptional ArsR family regulator
MPKQSPTVDRVFHALSCPARRVIVERLTRGAASVTQLAEPLAMALPSVMQHLRVLEDCGLVRSEKSGRVRTCRIEPSALAKAEDWLSKQRAEWERRLDRLDDYLTELQEKEKDRDDSN